MPDNSSITFPVSFLGLPQITENAQVQDFLQTLTFRPHLDEGGDYETEASFELAIYGFSELADEYCLCAPFWIATCLKFLSGKKYQAAQIAIDQAKEIILTPGFEEDLEIFGCNILDLTSFVYLMRGENEVLFNRMDN